jgi:hypothetical protein
LGGAIVSRETITAVAKTLDHPRAWRKQHNFVRILVQLPLPMKEISFGQF